jgi:hypothetical protein
MSRWPLVAGFFAGILVAQWIEPVLRRLRWLVVLLALASPAAAATLREQAEAAVAGKTDAEIAAATETTHVITHGDVRAVLIDALVIGGTNAADLWTTGECFATNPDCYEANPYAATGDHRAGLKLAEVTLVTGACVWLRLEGHDRLADFVRYFELLKGLLLVGNNLRQARR